MSVLLEVLYLSIFLDRPKASASSELNSSTAHLLKETLGLEIYFAESINTVRIS